MTLTKHYLSQDAGHDFTFRFQDRDGEIDISCLARPSFNGQDPNPTKTHLFESGQICFVQGRAPRTQGRAEELAAQWAEYFLRYRQTGFVEA